MPGNHVYMKENIKNGCKVQNSGYEQKKTTTTVVDNMMRRPNSIRQNKQAKAKSESK